MIRVIARWSIAALLLVPAAVSAEPIKLKFSYFSSDRTLLYETAVKPFIEAVNAAAKGQLEVEVHFSGALGNLAQQAEIVRNGTADIAFVVPGITPQLFPDNGVIEMPGLFRDGYEATMVYTRLVAGKMLRGYDDFFVIGALATPPESIHTRAPATSLADLRDKRIRANNEIKKAALEKLGMIGVLMPVNQAADAVAAGTLDGVAIPPTPLFDFGIGRFATNHYFLGVGAAPLTVLMNRKKFESLPAAAKNIIRKHSGEWLGQRFSEAYDSDNRLRIEKLKADPRRMVVFPSAADNATAELAFRTVVNEWIAKDARHEELHAAALSEVAKHRSAGATSGARP